jgi:hypothetical protein
MTKRLCRDRMVLEYAEELKHGKEFVGGSETNQCKLVTEYYRTKSIFRFF